MGFLRIVIPLAAALITFGPLALLVGWIGRKRNWTKKKRLLLTLLPGLVLYFAGGYAYFGIYNHADETARAALASTESVTVSEIRGGYFFDGEGSEKALIFYPGAKVEAAAYAPLMQQIAEGGMDCFLLEMPLHMAFLGQDFADHVIGVYDYDEWYLGGHSLGGAVSAFYAAEHPGTLSGLVLLAAYPAKPLEKDLPVLLVYGDRDTVMRREVYEENRVNWTSESSELILQGANHAQFGNYGLQRGDGDASITDKEQQRRTAEAVLNLAGVSETSQTE